MKKTIHSFSLIFMLTRMSFIESQQPTKAKTKKTTAGKTTAKTNTTPTLSQTIKKQAANKKVQQRLLLESSQRYVFAAWPEYPVSSVSQNPPLYPTTSINEAAVESFYKGIPGVDSTLINYLKIFYFYLEYGAKRERAAQILTLADQHNINATALLQSGGWSALIKALPQNSNLSTVPLTQDSWDSVTVAMTTTFATEKKDLAQFWTLLTSTSFWTDLTLTNDDLQHSLFWQDLTKVMIAKTYELDSGLLQGRVINEQQLFRYLPTLETSYYLPNYTEQRYCAELTQLALVLNEHCRNRYLKQSTDWGLLIDPTTKGLDYSTILLKAKCFQASHFYQILHNFSVPSCDASGTAALSAFQRCDASCDPFCDPSGTDDKISCADVPFVLHEDGSYTFKQVALPAPFKHEILFLLQHGSNFANDVI